VRYILAVIGFIIGFILLIVLIVTLRPSTSSTNRTNTPSPKLADLASTDATVRYSTAGPINAQEDHREIRITVNNDERVVDVLQGYQGDVLAHETFTNSTEAYQSFLAGLDRAGFTLTKKTNLDTEAGLCPTSNRYVYELYDTPANSAYKAFRRWSISCGTTASFGGSASTVRTLFTSQIPNYATFINDTPGASAINF